MDWLLLNIADPVLEQMGQRDAEGNPPKFTMNSLADRTKELARHRAEAALADGTPPDKAAAIQERFSVSTSTVKRLREGEITNPRIDTVFGIADAFQLPRKALIDDPDVNPIFAAVLDGHPNGVDMILELRNLRRADDLGIFAAAMRATIAARGLPGTTRAAIAGTFLTAFQVAKPDPDFSPGLDTPTDPASGASGP
ncbi:hypothetical protein ACWDRB_47620 [Nonomuraea sp. NPDC003707]